MIRLGYFAAVEQLRQSVDSSPTEHARTDAEHDLEHVHELHLAHCFDYLRQAILCAGDTTIEWAREEGADERPSQVDGWDIEHQCRSSQAIYEFTMENSAENGAKGIVNDI